MGQLACGQIDTYADDVSQIAQLDRDLANEIADFTGINQVVEWMSRRSNGKCAIDMIGMDEFEYDFLVQTDGRWLVFGVT